MILTIYVVHSCFILYEKHLPAKSLQPSAASGTHTVYWLISVVTHDHPPCLPLLNHMPVTPSCLSWFILKCIMVQTQLCHMLRYDVTIYKVKESRIKTEKVMQPYNGCTKQRYFLLISITILPNNCKREKNIQTTIQLPEEATLHLLSYCFDTWLWLGTAVLELWEPTLAQCVCTECIF